MSSSDKKTLGLKRFKKNGLDTVWSTVSTCIFESNQNRSVIGRYDGTSFTSFDEETLAYVSQGSAEFSDDNSTFSAEDGDLIRSFKTKMSTRSSVEIVVVSKQ